MFLSLGNYLSISYLNHILVFWQKLTERHVKAWIYLLTQAYTLHHQIHSRALSEKLLRYQSLLLTHIHNILSFST